jgi:hypothetical protein
MLFHWNERKRVFEVILVFEYLVYANSAALLPGFTDQQPELHTILEQPGSLAEDWLHTAPALRSLIPLSFLGCTALSSVQSTKYHNATCGNSLGVSS